MAVDRGSVSSWVGLPLAVKVTCCTCTKVIGTSMAASHPMDSSLELFVDNLYVSFVGSPRYTGSSNLSSVAATASIAVSQIILLTVDLVTVSEPDRMAG